MLVCVVLNCFYISFAEVYFYSDIGGDDDCDGDNVGNADGGYGDGADNHYADANQPMYIADISCSSLKESLGQSFKRSAINAHVDLVLLVFC